MSGNLSSFSFLILFNIDKEEGDELVQGLDHLQIGVFVPTLLLVLLPKVIVTPTPTAKVLSSVAKTTAGISIQEHIKWLIVVLSKEVLILFFFFYT